MIFQTVIGWAQDQPFACDGDYYLSVSHSRTAPSVITRMTYDNNSQTLRWDTLAANTNRQINPIGFRVLDGFIYGLDKNTLELLRIDAAGKNYSRYQPER